MLLDAASGAFVAARAQVEVERQNALTFVEALFNETIEQRIDLRRAAQRAERLFNQSPTQRRELPDHLEKRLAVQPRELEVIQRRAGCGSKSSWDRGG